MSDPQSPLGLDSSNLFHVALIISTLIVLGVGGVVLYSIFRFRGRPGEEAPQQDFGNRRLEIAWTVAPALLLAIITFFTIPALARIEVDTSRAADGSEPAFVHVIGHQWWWEVRYPQTGAATANEIHIPTGQRLLVQLDSNDVVHDLWVPQLTPKEDLNPGNTNWMWLQADKPGTYLGACAEYCGTQHAWMLIRVVAQPQAEFNTWLQQISAPAAAATGDAARGAQVFQQRTCVSCHSLDPRVSNALAGPNLAHFGSRQILGSGVLTNTPANVRTWLQNPQAVKPGNHMPNLRLSDQELNDLTAYMESLK